MKNLMDNIREEKEFSDVRWRTSGVPGNCGLMIVVDKFDSSYLITTFYDGDDLLVKQTLGFEGHIPWDIFSKQLVAWAFVRCSL